MKLVVDASVAVAALATPIGLERLGSFDLVAPPLRWIETASVLHEAMWRGEIPPERASELRRRLADAPVARVEPKALADET